MKKLLLILLLPFLLWGCLHSLVLVKPDDDPTYYKPAPSAPKVQAYPNFYEQQIYYPIKSVWNRQTQRYDYWHFDRTLEQYVPGEY